MGVTVCLPLFGPPGREMEEGVVARSQQLRDLAASLHERLLAAADTLDKLAGAGWTARVAMYDLILSRHGVDTQEEAVAQLTALGIVPEEMLIIEDVDEEENESP
jgi:hypothetical protein